MAIPTYTDLMLPVLQACTMRDWTMRELIAHIADKIGLTPEERVAPIPSGGSTVIATRVHWAKTYLKQAGLLEQPKRAIVRITPRGRQVVADPPQSFDGRFLETFPEFREFVSRKSNKAAQTDSGVVVVTPEDATPAETPEERIDLAVHEMTATLRESLLARVVESTPLFFERLILDLLLAMGYGGSRQDASEHMGRSGDGGIDGMIREDRLGLDRIYLQAKRYAPGNNVGPEAVQAFIGALVGRGAHKGVFITTSAFTSGAQRAASQSGSLRLVLIDGEMLTDLMIRFNVGVRVASTLEIKRVDQDYFLESEPE